MKFNISFPKEEEQEFVNKVRNMQRTIQRARDAFLRFNMYVLQEYRYEDWKSNQVKYSIAELEKMASMQAKEEAQQDLEVFSKAMAWVLYVLACEEIKKSIKPQYVFVRSHLGEIWGWQYPAEYTIIFEIWADFATGPKKIDITSVKVEAEKIKYTEYHGRVWAIFEDLLITGLQENGYKVL